jgi:hypothetical protein
VYFCDGVEALRSIGLSLFLREKNSGQRNWVILTWCFTLNVTFHFIKQDTQSIIGGNLKEVDIIK